MSCACVCLLCVIRCLIVPHVSAGTCVCTCILFGKKNKIKLDDSCVKRRLYQSLLNPDLPLISGLYLLLSFQTGARGLCAVHVLICGIRVYDIKHIKRVAWRNKCLALQTGCLPFPPQRVRKMSCFLCGVTVCLFWGVLLFVQECVWNGEPT